jgi:hypothetical protein
MFRAPSPAPSAAAPGFSRRRLFAATSAAGLALLASGCTSASTSTPARDRVTDRQADALAAQVTVQEGVVAAYTAATPALTAAAAALGAALATMSGQAGSQLARLRAAAPGSGTSGSASGTGPGAAAPTTVAGPPAGTDPKVWLATQVTTAADSHAAACLGQSGARAALLGSVAAGLRAQAGRLA